MADRVKGLMLSQCEVAWAYHRAGSCVPVFPMLEGIWKVNSGSLSGHIVLSKKRGSKYGHQNIVILLMGTPEW